MWCINNNAVVVVVLLLILFSPYCVSGNRDAWHKLGDMPKEEAMQSYVEELKKVSSAIASLLANVFAVLRLVCYTNQ